jgi:trigger factor
MGRIEFVHEGEAVAERDGVRLSPKHPPRGVEEAPWKETLSQATTGAEFELPLTFTEDYPKEELRGQTGVATIRVDQVFELERPSDEELFQAFSVEDRAGLEERFTEELKAQKERAEQNRIETELLERVIAAHPMPLPEPMLEAQIEARRAQAMEQLQSQGVPEAEATAQVDAEAAGTRTAAENSLRALFLVERIGEEEQLAVNQQDLVAELRQIALRNRAEFDEVRKYYEEQGLLQQLSVELLERKVRQLLREQAQLGS